MVSTFALRYTVYATLYWNTDSFVRNKLMFLNKPYLFGTTNIIHNIYIYVCVALEKTFSKSEAFDQKLT